MLKPVHQLKPEDLLIQQVGVTKDHGSKGHIEELTDVLLSKVYPINLY